MALVGRTHNRGVESGRSAESGRIRRRPRNTVWRLWNVPVTAADAQVGDADVSGRPGKGVITPPCNWGYPPLQGSREVVCADIVEGRPEGVV